MTSEAWCPRVWCGVTGTTPGGLLEGHRTVCLTETEHRFLPGEVDQAYDMAGFSAAQFLTQCQDCYEVVDLAGLLRRQAKVLAASQP